MELKGRFWIWYWVAITLLAAYYTSWDYAVFRKEPVHLILLNVPQQFVWGVLGVLVIQVARRCRIEAPPWKALWPWLLHLAVTILVTAVGVLLNWLIAYFMTPSLRDKPFNPALIQKNIMHFFWSYYHTSWLVMVAVVGAVHGYALVQRLKERELTAALMESRMAQAQNLALRMQLQPHFLFNALNSVTALIYSDPEGADRMLSRLAELLRMSLDRSPEQELCLHEELDFMERYLSLERIRYGDRLDVHVEVPPDLALARVPNLVLQPLVENAIKHGISSRAEGGRIWIRAWREGEQLVLEVQDDGEGFTERAEGIGLSSTRERLRLLYKDRYRFDLSSRTGKGTLATVRIPLAFMAAPKGA